MNEDDSLGGGATAIGILQCLRMLAEEAATLRLSRTVVALRDAIEACASERDDTRFEFDDTVATSPLLH